MSTHDSHPRIAHWEIIKRKKNIYVVRKVGTQFQNLISRPTYPIPYTRQLLRTTPDYDRLIDW